MTSDLIDDLHRLRDTATPAPITVADLPASLRERFIGKNGKWLVRVFARESLWDFQPLQHFVGQTQKVDPEVTGKPFSTLEGLRSMKHGFLGAGLYALLAIVLVLYCDFRQPVWVALALAPLALGLLGALGVLGLCGVTLNPANLIALPLVLGVGVDNGVHVLHDWLGRRGQGPYSLDRATSRGIFVAGLTTILGFGTLMLSTHRGLASLGLVLALGVTFSMVSALVILPALLRRL